MRDKFITRPDLDLALARLHGRLYPVGTVYKTTDNTFDANVSFGGTWTMKTSYKDYTVIGSLTAAGSGGPHRKVHTLAQVQSLFSSKYGFSPAISEITFNFVNVNYDTLAETMTSLYNPSTTEFLAKFTRTITTSETMTIRYNYTVSREDGYIWTRTA